MPGNDLSIYSDYAHEWWVPGSARFRSLQGITPFRLQIIREWCGDLSGKTVVDFGCGGGLLAVPILQMGADVIGVDISGPSIQEAKRAANGRGRFIVGDIRKTPLQGASADLILIADVLDHISDYELVLKEAARVAKPGGGVLIGTLNRNLLSWFMAILLGEGLGLIPKGTHDHRLFIKPSELIARANMFCLSFERSQGEFPLLFQTARRWAIAFRRARTVALAYQIMFRKKSDDDADGDVQRPTGFAVNGRRCTSLATAE